MSDLSAGSEPLRLFGDYLRVTGVAHLGPEPDGAPGLVGKRLGLLNGSSWITLWSNYFGRMYLPGVHLINMGNEALQINFMDAHERGLPCPPAANIQAFVRYARDLVDFARVHAVLITCSTMNRAYDEVARAGARGHTGRADRPADDGASGRTRRQGAGRGYTRADSGQHAGFAPRDSGRNRTRGRIRRNNSPRGLGPACGW